MVSAKQVKELRNITGVGMMDCKKALQEVNGDHERALKILREKGFAKAAKKGGRPTTEGVIDSYIHLNNRIGVLIEVNCETDFVARNKEYSSLVRDICLHIAATNPSYLNRNKVPPSIIEQEKEILKKQALNEGKPEKIAEKIVSGRLEKFYAENCLMEQAFVKDPDVTVARLIMDKIAKIGENIVIRRFARFELGEDIDDGRNKIIC